MLGFVTNKKGFTLVEVLLLVFMIGLLGTIAISSYMSSTATFKFLSDYRQLRSPLDAARSYAITNRTVNGEVPDRYGVCVSANSVVLFADVGDLPMRFGAGERDDLGNCVSESVNGDEDVVISKYLFEDDYEVRAFAFEGDLSEDGRNLLGEDDGDFVLVFYDSEGTAAVVHDNRPISETNFEFFLKFVEKDSDRPSKTIKLYLLTGLYDEFES